MQSYFLNFMDVLTCRISLVVTFVDNEFVTAARFSYLCVRNF